MEKITSDTVRAYAHKLEQKGYSNELIARKLNSTLEYLRWAYHNDLLKYSVFQQLKDEIANIKIKFVGTDFHKAQSIEPMSVSHIPTIQDFSKATYQGEKTTEGLGGEFHFKFKIEKFKLKSFLNGILEKIPLLGGGKTYENTPHDNIYNSTTLSPQFYIGMAFVVLVLGILGAGIYERFLTSTNKIFAYPSSPSAASRILSFQGRLTDSLGNPITAATNMRFRLYTASSGGTTLYDSGTCSISPDQDGVHNVLIGSDCGSEIASSVFTENTQVWLGVLVGSDSEMTPRQRIANVPYAINAETLQGLPVGTEVSTIPYINAGGDLLMAATSPQIGSTYTNQDFLISSARAITIQSAGAGDVTLTATESGTIKFATGGSQHGLITNGGLFGFGTTGPDAKLDVLYTGGEQLRLTYTDGSNYTGFTTNSGGDLTIDPSGDDITLGGDLILADTFTAQIGGKTGTAYNAFANSSDAPESGSISSDNDVYIGGDLEVDGSIIGTINPGFTQGSIIFTDGSGNLAQDNTSLFFDDTNNLIGIGTASPVGKLHVTGAATGKALSIFNETGDQNIITASASGTTVANLDRSGNLAIEGAISDLGGATLAVNDNLDVSGTLFSGTADAFQVDASGNITAVGTTLSGDIAVNGGDITSTSTAFKFDIGNTGSLSFRDGTNSLVTIKDQGVYPFLNLAAKTDTGDPASCAEGDIYYNDTDDTIKICHESNTWEALDGGAVATSWTDSGTTVYLTDTTDEVVIGGSTPLSSAKLSIDGDADQIQFIVQGNATQTTNLATFEQSDGTDVFTITNAGNLTTAGDLAVNGDDITGDSNLTINAASYTRIGDTASPGSATGDDDLFVESDIELDGVLYLDGTLDTTFTAGSVVFAGTSGVLAQDNANFYWDDANNKFGLGTTAPDAKLQVTGAATGKALTILNETGDQDIIAASASGVTRFRVGNDGTVYGGYFADISNTAYGIDPAGTSNFGGYSLKITGGALLAADSGNVGIGDQTPDAKLNILATTEQLRLDYDDSNYSSFTVSSGGDLTIAPTGSDTNVTGNLAISDGTTLGDASGDTVTANAAAWTFANDTTIALSGGVNGINFDSNTLSIDATNDRVGIGTAAPSYKLDVYGPSRIYSATAADTTLLRLKHDVWTNDANEVVNLEMGLQYSNALIRTGVQSHGDNSSYISFLPSSSNENNFVEVMRVVGNVGRVGIGSTGPDAKLDSLATSGEQLRLTYTDGSAYTGFTVASTGDLTLDTTGGDINLANADVLNIGGSGTDVAYNAIGDSLAGAANVNSDNDLYIEDDLEVDGTIFGNISGTITPGFTQGSVIFTGASGELAQDNASFFFDDSGNKLGIGDTTPDAFLDVTGTTEQLRLSYETGDTNYASFTLSSGGDLTIAPTGGDLALTGDVDVSDQLAAGANGAITANQIVNIANNTVPVDTTGSVGLSVSQTETGSGSSSAGHQGIYNYLANNSSSTGNISNYGIKSDLYNQNAAVGTNSDWRNFFGFVKNEATANIGTYNYYALSQIAATTTASTLTNFYSSMVNGSATGTTMYGYYAASPTNASGSITTSYGMRIDDQSVGTNTTAYGLYIASQAGASGDNVGLYIADAEDYSIQLASTDGDAASGITFGTDTNLYRSAADTLKTDDAFFAVGNITTSGDLAVNGNDITSSGNLTLNATGYTRVGDTASPGSATGDDDLFVESDIELDGVLYLDGTIDTTFTAGSVVFAGTSGVLAQDNASFFFDDSGNKLGIGDTTPDAFLDVTGTTAQLRLSYETGDTNYTTFTTDSGGDLTVAPTGGDVNITGNLAVTGNTGLGNASTDVVTVTGNEIINFDTASSNQNGLYINSSQNTATGGTLRGLNVGANFWATSGTQTGVNGLDFTVQSSGNGGTVTTMKGISAWGVVGTGSTVNTFKLVDAANPTNSGTITSLSGFSVDNLTSGANNTLILAGTNSIPAGNWGIYNSSSYSNYFSGTTGIGTAGADAKLDVLSTSEQLRLTYTDGSAYSSFTVNSGGDLTLAPSGGDTSVTGNLAISGNTTLGDATGDTITFTGRVASTIDPSANDTYDLGSDSLRWRDIYLGPDTLHVGTSTSDEGTMKYVTSTNVLTFTNNFGDTDFGSTSDGFNFTLGGGAGDDFIVDTTTLVVESDNDRVGIGTAAPDGKLHVTGASTGKALTILNETGDQNPFVASVSGTQVFTVTNNGDVVQSKNGSISGLADNESLAPNPSFEINSDGVYPPDGWADTVGTQTTTSTSNHGDTALLFDTDTDATVSNCFPIAGGKNLAQGLGTDRTYTVSLWSQLVNGVANNGLNAGLYTFTSKSNCTSNTSATKRAAFANSSPTTVWGFTSGTITPSVADTWARAYVIYDYTNNDADMRVDGVMVAQTNNTSGLDLAETYPANSADNIQIGEIVSFGTGIRQHEADVNNIERSSGQYDNHAFGVVATQPGIVLDDNKTYSKVKVALKGRVPVLVTTENGPIKVGDPITASSRPGIGMKATRSGRIIGYAMSEWTSQNSNEVDQVTVFVNPETYVDLSILTSLQESVAKLPTLTASALSRADDIVINSADALLIKTERLVAQSVTVVNATIDNLIVDRIVSREITAKKVETDSLTAQKVTTDSIATQDLSAKNATFSGKLVAQEIDADNIRELRDRLEKLSAENDAAPTIDSKQLQSEVENIQQYLENLPDQDSSHSLPVDEITTNTSIDPGTTTSMSGDQISMMNVDKLTVTGESAMTSLVVADSFSAGNIFIKDNAVLSLSNELKLSALEQISLMDGAVIIAKNGTITAKGEVIAEKGVRTNTIRPIDANNGVGVQLSQNKVEVLNNDAVVAAIDSKGSAKFKDVSVDTYTDATGSAAIIAAADNFEENGLFSPAIQTNAAAAGNGILPAKSDTVVIYNDKIGPQTLIYVTATSKTYNNNLYIEDKKSCTEQEKLEENCKPYFTVHIDAVVKDPITFNWWTVN